MKNTKLAAGALSVIAAVALWSGLADETQPVDSPTAAAVVTEPAEVVPAAPAAPAVPAEPQFVPEWNVAAAGEAELAGIWHPGCPVGPGELRLITVSYWGFDGAPHVGTLVVNAAIADQTVRGFQGLYEQRFPINRIDHRPLAPEADLDPERWSTTAAYVCRQKRGSSSWSEHAYGTAVDINPFHNPMVKRGQLISGGAQYVERNPGVPGLLTADSPAVRAFTDQGLTWGGTWTSSQDYMHFSLNGN